MSRNDAEKMARNTGCFCYCETSARNLLGLRELFQAVLEGAIPNGVSKPKKGLFGLFGKNKNVGGSYVPLPVPPVMPPAGKAPAIEIFQSTFGKDLKTLMNSDFCSDVSLICERTEIPSHKVILHISCDIFQELFELIGNNLEFDETEVLHNFSKVFSGVCWVDNGEDGKRY